MKIAMALKSILVNSEEKSPTSNRLECRICKQRFWMTCKFIEHMSTHKHFLLTCNICNRGFSDQKNLDEHYVTHKEVINTYDCTQCHRKFLQKYQLEQHMQFHTILSPRIESHVKKRKIVHFNTVLESRNINDKLSEDDDSSKDDKPPNKAVKTRSGRIVKVKNVYEPEDEYSDDYEGYKPPVESPKSRSGHTVKKKKKLENETKHTRKNVYESEDIEDEYSDDDDDEDYDCEDYKPPFKRSKSRSRRTVKRKKKLENDIEIKRTHKNSDEILDRVENNEQPAVVKTANELNFAGKKLLSASLSTTNSTGSPQNTVSKTLSIVIERIPEPIYRKYVEEGNICNEISKNHTTARKSIARPLNDRLSNGNKDISKSTSVMPDSNGPKVCKNSIQDKIVDKHLNVPSKSNSLMSPEKSKVGSSNNVPLNDRLSNGNKDISKSTSIMPHSDGPKVCKNSIQDKIVDKHLNVPSKSNSLLSPEKSKVGSSNDVSMVSTKFDQVKNIPDNLTNSTSKSCSKNSNAKVLPCNPRVSAEQTQKCNSRVNNKTVIEKPVNMSTTHIQINMPNSNRVNQEFLYVGPEQDINKIRSIIEEMKPITSGNVNSESSLPVNSPQNVGSLKKTGSISSGKMASAIKNHASKDKLVNKSVNKDLSLIESEDGILEKKVVNDFLLVKVTPELMQKIQQRKAQQSKQIKTDSVKSLIVDNRETMSAVNKTGKKNIETKDKNSRTGSVSFELSPTTSKTSSTHEAVSKSTEINYDSKHLQIKPVKEVMPINSTTRNENTVEKRPELNNLNQEKNAKIEYNKPQLTISPVTNERMHPHFKEKNDEEKEKYKFKTGEKIKTVEEKDYHRIQISAEASPKISETKVTCEDVKMSNQTNYSLKHLQTIPVKEVMPMSAVRGNEKRVEQKTIPVVNTESGSERRVEHKSLPLKGVKFMSILKEKEKGVEQKTVPVTEVVGKGNEIISVNVVTPINVEKEIENRVEQKMIPKKEVTPTNAAERGNEKRVEQKTVSLKEVMAINVARGNENNVEQKIVKEVMTINIGKGNERRVELKTIPVKDVTSISEARENEKRVQQKTELNNSPNETHSRIECKKSQLVISPVINEVIVSSVWLQCLKEKIEEKDYKKREKYKTKIAEKVRASAVKNCHTGQISPEPLITSETTDICEDVTTDICEDVTNVQTNQSLTQRKTIQSQEIQLDGAESFCPSKDRIVSSFRLSATCSSNGDSKSASSMNKITEKNKEMKENNFGTSQISARVSPNISEENDICETVTANMLTNHSSKHLQIMPVNEVMPINSLAKNKKIHEQKTELNNFQGEKDAKNETNASQIVTSPVISEKILQRFKEKIEEKDYKKREKYKTKAAEKVRASTVKNCHIGQISPEPLITSETTDLCEDVTNIQTNQSLTQKTLQSQEFQLDGAESFSPGKDRIVSSFRLSATCSLNGDSKSASPMNKTTEINKETKEKIFDTSQISARVSPNISEENDICETVRANMLTNHSSKLLQIMPVNEVMPINSLPKNEKIHEQKTELDNFQGEKNARNETSASQLVISPVISEKILQRFKEKIEEKERKKKEKYERKKRMRHMEKHYINSPDLSFCSKTDLLTSNKDKNRSLKLKEKGDKAKSMTKSVEKNSDLTDKKSSKKLEVKENGEHSDNSLVETCKHLSSPKKNEDLSLKRVVNAPHSVRFSPKSQAQHEKLKSKQCKSSDEEAIQRAYEVSLKFQKSLSEKGCLKLLNELDNLITNFNISKKCPFLFTIIRFCRLYVDSYKVKEQAISLHTKLTKHLLG